MVALQLLAAFAGVAATAALTWWLFRKSGP
jgi:hypothetical protein